MREKPVISSFSRYLTP